MKSFYQSSYYFWIIIKVIIALAGFISFIDNISNYQLSATELIANLLTFVYAVFLVVDVIISLNGNCSKILKYTTGTLSLFIAVVFIGILATIGVISVTATVLVVTLFILVGLFDLLLVTKKK
jgi:hypothetical protein